MAVDAIRLQAVIAPVRKALRSDFIRHGALVFGATMAGSVLNYVFNFTLSRRLGVEGFAELSSLVSLLMILSIPTSILSLIVVKYAAIYHAAADAARVRRLSQQMLRWSLAAAGVVFFAAATFHQAIASFLRIDDAALVTLCATVIAIGLVTSTLRSILQGEQDFGRFSVSSLLEIGIKVVLAVAVVYAGFGVRGAMLSWLMASSCALVFTLWAVFGGTKRAATESVRLGLDLRRLAVTTTGVAFSTAFLTLMSFMDVVLVKHYFSAHEAGFYAAVNLTGKIVLFVVAFLPAVVLPKAVAKTAAGENAAPLLLQAAGATVLMSGAVLTIFGVFAAPVVRIVAGRDFVPASQYVLQYDAAMCMLALLTLLVNYRIAVHRFQFLYPLGVVLAAEIACITVFHQSLWDVVHILLLGNLVAVGACAIGIKPRVAT